MSYGNQPDHRIIDRRLVAPVLLELSVAHTAASPTRATRAEHLVRLQRRCESSLELEYLSLLESAGHLLPDEAQQSVPAAHTRPDFLYREHRVAVYVDGPSHLYPDRAQRDRLQTSELEDLGWTVLRFPAQGDWSAIIAANPSTFGSPQ